MMGAQGQADTGTGGMSAQQGGWGHGPGGGEVRRGPGLWAAVLAFGLLVVMTAASLKVLRDRPTPLIENSHETRRAKVDAVAVMGPSHVIARSDGFRRAEAIAVMGHTVLDLREVTPAEGPVAIEAVAVMGHVEIIVPPDWEIVTDDMLTAGAYRNLARKANVDNPRKVRLDGVIVMGRLEIRR